MSTVATGAGGATYDRVKRAFDVVFAAIVLILTAPIVAVACLAIRLESPGHALFRQRRMGLHGRCFELVKLRGMHVDAHRSYPHLYAYETVGVSERATYTFHQGDRLDPRVTRVGRFLRRHSIDELPNFVNVLRGEMSIVGPRPEIPELAHLYGDDLRMLLSVRPGITSPAKATGRDALTFEETLRLELAYVADRSLALDLRTIARTAAGVIRGKSVR